MTPRGYLILLLSVFVGVPLAIAGFAAFSFFVYSPLLHKWHVYRMDAKNDVVWVEEIAKVATVEMELYAGDASKTLSQDIICFQGHWARPWTMKGGPPHTGEGPMSVGLEALETEWVDGSVLFVSFRRFCRHLYREDSSNLPANIKEVEVALLPRDLSFRCRYPRHKATDRYIMVTDAGKLGYPTVVSINDAPLKSVATREQVGSSQVSRFNSILGKRYGLVKTASPRKDEDPCQAGNL